jgi:nucleotide-binding universal stress UspA family protein
MAKILVPTDFTPAADNALELACLMAAVGEWEITLFHVMSSHSRKLLANKGRKKEELDAYMDELCEMAAGKHAVKVVKKITEGSLISAIIDAASEHAVEWVLMGTHGTRGIRQALFGADALKIAEKSPVPVLTVPDKADVSKGINRILFPFGGHENFDNKVDAVGTLAQHFNAEVEFYSINRPEAEASRSIMESIKAAEAGFSNEGIVNSLTVEEVKSFSVGFARQTLEYAEQTGANVIAVMSSDAGNLSFISSVDRENLINNDKGISILLVNEI